MKVLLVHKFHRLTGGAEVFYFEVARILKENGHEVAFFSTGDPDNIISSDALYTVPPPGYDANNIFSKITSAKDIFYSGRNRKVMEKALNEFKPDIVHVFAIHVHLSPSILEAVKARDIPVVMSCNDYKHICPNYKLYDGKALCEACKGGAFYQAVLKKCCQNSYSYSIASAIETYVHQYKNVYRRLIDLYLFSSHFMLDKTEEFWQGRGIKTGLLRNPFDVGAYEPKYSGDYALYFGRLVNEKGVQLLLDAANHVEMPIKIIGDGPDLKYVSAQLQENRLGNVELLGPLWGDELTRVLYDAAFVVVPSLWHENFPYVILQSFAAGKPVIGSMRGGIPEMLGDNGERGLLFEPDDVTDLPKKMRALWDDSRLVYRMGQSARLYVEREFSDARFYQSIMDNYGRVLT